MPYSERKKLAGAIVVREYEKLRRFAESWAAGHFNLVVLVGRGGLGKSKAVKNAVGKQALWIRGTASAFGMYQSLYKHRGQPIVIDDVDKIYNDANSVRLLKCVCETDKFKHVSWHTGAAGAGKEIPKDFETTSKVMIIANDWSRLNENISALETRGHLLKFEPSLVEIHQKAAEFFWDQELYDAIGERLHLLPELNLRTYSHAWELKSAGMEWLDILHREGYDERTIVVAKLLADKNLLTDSQRIARFREFCGGGRSTYYRYKKSIQPAGTKHILAPPTRLKKFAKPGSLRAM